MVGLQHVGITNGRHHFSIKDQQLIWTMEGLYGIGRNGLAFIAKNSQ